MRAAFDTMKSGWNGARDAARIATSTVAAAMPTAVPLASSRPDAPRATTNAATNAAAAPPIGPTHWPSRSAYARAAAASAGPTSATISTSARTAAASASTPPGGIDTHGIQFEYRAALSSQLSAVSREPPFLESQPEMHREANCSEAVAVGSLLESDRHDHFGEERAPSVQRKALVEQRR